jgi:hypothetical protein
MKQVMEHVRDHLRERPDSHFSEVYLRSLKRGTSGADVRNALYEMLKAGMRSRSKRASGGWLLVCNNEGRP